MPARVAGQESLRIRLAERGSTGEAPFGPLGLIAHTVEASFLAAATKIRDPVNTTEPIARCLITLWQRLT
jgi:hypothetical protein